MNQEISEGWNACCRMRMSRNNMASSRDHAGNASILIVVNFKILESQHRG